MQGKVCERWFLMIKVGHRGLWVHLSTLSHKVVVALSTR
jgi:hypothetical protein